ncbi:carotenoid biosynthesis protein [Listeria monocytogenes]|uniref:carotenoid biosynthesis protein n=1 Tax=Listeria monocytogenes TaxID=1639 RepID=UPI0008746195|nr:carotenoid biosynthesis protein [Listeria monocytogenes]EAC3172104.1 carotenoid biosynthesis protein [Listeria monocytogenes]EAC7320567.1 carotenoid biosynthesis protein [Listeria monocytogenes]EAD0023276.1 carotenoid biosynthesis protein [Listeria monocytogenes]EAD9895767.1 carotenoid biosynthesis protein [Listeria monocytogenes]EAF6093181.1 carotenoid biosynthesis protein [Listeria monocytogenes]
MLEKNYKFLLWIYIFWFLGSVLLVSLRIIPPELTAVQSLFLVFTGVFAAVFFIMQYGKWLGSAITLLIFVVSTCIEWMQLSYTDEYIGSTLGGSVYGIPITMGFIWVGMVAGTHIIAREITLKINIDWIRGGIYSFIAATMVMIFEVLIEPITMQSKQLYITQNGFTILQLSDFINWWLLGLILHLMIYFILSLTDSWERLKYPDLKSEIVIVYWIIIAFFVFLSFYLDLWTSIAIIIVSNIIFTACYFFSLEKEAQPKKKSE